MDPKLQAAQRRARRELWRRGELSFLLDSTQVTLYREIREKLAATYVLEMARRLGKSHLLVAMAIETCLRAPNVRVVYLAQTQKAARDVSKDLIRPLIADAPDDVRPTFAVTESSWLFPNGSRIDLGGADDEGQVDRLRGGAAVLVIVDEAGFVRCLRYALTDVLKPLTMTTGGTMLIATSPPKSPGHDFVGIADAAAAVGNYAHRTIYDNPRLTPAQIESYIADSALQAGLTVESFKKTTTYRREYLAERCTDAESAVVPEWPDAEAVCAVEHPRPLKLNPCAVIDPGFQRDLTGAVAGYYDFLEGVVVIEDELALRRAPTEQIGNELKRLEAERYPGMKVARFIDEPGRMAADLYASHGLACGTVLEKSREADINFLRALVSQRKLRIDPRCKVLLRQLRNAVYTSNGEDWERSALDGHQDVLAACIYFVRLVPRGNPYPPGWGLIDRDNQMLAGGRPRTGQSVGRQLMQGSAVGRLLTRN